MRLCGNMPHTAARRARSGAAAIDRARRWTCNRRDNPSDGDTSWFPFRTGLGTGHSHSLSIDDHHVITHLHARREGRFVFAKQHVRDACGYPAQVLTRGIHQNPLAFDFASFRIVRLVHFLYLRFFSYLPINSYSLYFTSTNVNPCAGASRMEFRFGSQPENVSLKNQRLHPLKLIPCATAT